MANKDEFKLTNLPIEAQDKSISKDDFKLVSQDAKIYDKKFNTKPTTFFKDCMKRFAKNKSSVVAAFILGILFLMSIIVPLFGPKGSVHAVNVSHSDIVHLEPKLFSKGNFWSGKKAYKDVPVDINTGYPDENTFDHDSISDMEPSEEKYITTSHKYGKDGYLKYSAYQNAEEGSEFYVSPLRSVSEFDFGTADLVVKKFTVLGEDDLKNSDERTKTLPEGYEFGESALRFVFKLDGDTEANEHKIIISDFKKSHHENNINVNALFNAYKLENSYTTSKVTDLNFEFVIKGEPGKNVSTLAKELVFETNSTAQVGLIKEQIESYSFTSGNDAMLRDPESSGYWVNRSDTLYCEMSTYLVKAVTASFMYDVYNAKLGLKSYPIGRNKLQSYIANGWIKTNILNSSIYTFNEETGKYEVNGTFYFNIEEDQKDNCPIAEKVEKEDIVFDEEEGVFIQANCKVYQYKYLYNLNKMPIFLMGTDKTGRDMFINVFQGLRTSLLLGIGTTVVCFIFGLIWGSICGYFGGTVDLVMERFTDILSGVPWIVVMTLVILKAGKSTFGVFALALCLTGWIGTAATTRTQFYRFRGREYVLASRTLGASHGRLIAKHILPNAMGTIITSAVLMVPSVIFSEATLSFLGLAHVGGGDSGLSSLGVTLSDNQTELMTHPYLLIFPSVIIALLMISFNLAGNGLRDAVNPSLKGEGE